jgi:hypothetical protein
MSKKENSKKSQESEESEESEEQDDSEDNKNKEEENKKINEALKEINNNKIYNTNDSVEINKININNTNNNTTSNNKNNLNTLNNTNPKNLLSELDQTPDELFPPRPELDEIETQNIKLLYPAEEGPGHPRTLFFMNDPEINSNKKSQLLNLTQLEIDQKKYMITYKAYRNIPQSLSGVMKYNQIVKSKLYTNTNLIWKLLDKDKMYPLLRKLNKYQRYNHFPFCWQLGRKDNLYINYLKMKKKFKDEYNYMPDKFILPQDRDIVQEKMKEYGDELVVDYWDNTVKPRREAERHGEQMKSKMSYTDVNHVPSFRLAPKDSKLGQVISDYDINSRIVKKYKKAFGGNLFPKDGPMIKVNPMNPIEYMH